VDEKNDQIAHRRIVAGREILMNYGRNYNSPETGGERCGGNADDDVHFGMKLIRKAVALDPSLIDRGNLQDMLNPKRN
jgi:hypothetical protein